MSKKQLLCHGFALLLAPLLGSTSPLTNGVALNYGSNGGSVSCQQISGALES